MRVDVKRRRLTLPRTMETAVKVFFSGKASASLVPFLLSYMRGQTPAYEALLALGDAESAVGPPERSFRCVGNHAERPAASPRLARAACRWLLRAGHDIGALLAAGRLERVEGVTPTVDHRRPCPSLVP